MYTKEIEESLRASDPISSLRKLAVQLNENGIGKKNVYDIFYKYSLEISEINRDNDVNLIEDVLDMISGWYVGRNLNLEE